MDTGAQAFSPRFSERDEVEETIAAALDQEFYRQEHAELAAADFDPLRHFIDVGHDAGSRPTPEFDTRFYLQRSPDVLEAGMNGFYHYLRWGQVEGRAQSAQDVQPSLRPRLSAERLIRAHVDSAFYLAENPGIARTHVAPYKHYLHFGWHAGLDPSPEFSTSYYRSAPYETDAHENPLHHYLRVGRRRGRLPYPLLPGGVGLQTGPAVEASIRPHFDEGFYRAAYPENVTSESDAVREYLELGWREGRNPAPWFSTSQYLARFPDIEVIGVNPFLHYLLWGRNQGFPPAQRAGDGYASILEPLTALASAEVAPLSWPGTKPSQEPVQVAPARLNVHWIVPDVEAPGRGGHMTIFRIIRWLEIFGHRCTVWVNDPHPDWTDDARRELIQASYQTIAAKVRELPLSPDFPPDALVVATSWTTALVLNAVPSARNRFYFVQDDERQFHPAGVKALAADRTYKLDMGYLCAGSWLADKLRSEYGRWTRAFDLAPDERYRPSFVTHQGGRPKIAFYARRHTERRAVELGLLTLQKLAQEGIEFEAHLFGSDTPLEAAPFPAVDHGVVEPERLAELYAECDLGLCFSATNYSLIPQEMMACGLPVLELDGPSTRAAFPPDVVTLAGPDPGDLAQAAARLLANPEAGGAQAKRAMTWVGTHDWEVSARAVETAMLERLRESGALIGAPESGQGRPEEPVATVVIPTLNGGEMFRRVLDRVLAQRTPWKFEVIVVDSASDDGTWALVEANPAVQSLSIKRESFQHGATRNLAASRARGEFIVFLTQDSEPADRLWLADLVGSLQQRPRAAGAFGRHLPRPDASPFTKRDLRSFFRQIGGRPLERSKFSDLNRWRHDGAFRRQLHFFSNNNSCLRRSVWLRLPFPEVDYGEDQLWAAKALDDRYSIVYAPTACVIHSHEYDENSRFERSRVEGRWLRLQFDYDIAPSDPAALIARMNAGDEQWGVMEGVDRREIERKKRLNAAEVAGLVAGGRL